MHNRQTPQDALMNQMEILTEAIEKLEAIRASLQDTDIDNAGWKDVAEFAMEAETARTMIETIG